MKLDEKKICFIICVNDDLFFKECYDYILWLDKPEGFEVEILEIRDAISMTSGYNEAMNRSNAKYKIYLHQDTFIRNKHFIFDIITIFSKDTQIGIIGLVGCLDMPKDGIMWHSNQVDIGIEAISWEQYRYSIIKDGYWHVDAVDGLLMATQYDIPWREDLFNGWDYYDASHCFEMRKKGYSIVVPLQNQRWYIHDDKDIINLWSYNKYRRIFLNEYML